MQKIWNKGTDRAANWNASVFTAATKTAVEDFYFQSYLDHYAKIDPVNRLLASVPTVSLTPTLLPSI